LGGRFALLGAADGGGRGRPEGGASCARLRGPHPHNGAQIFRRGRAARPNPSTQPRPAGARDRRDRGPAGQHPHRGADLWVRQHALFEPGGDGRPDRLPLRRHHLHLFPAEARRLHRRGAAGAAPPRRQPPPDPGGQSVRNRRDADGALRSRHPFLARRDQRHEAARRPCRGDGGGDRRLADPRLRLRQFRQSGDGASLGARGGGRRAQGGRREPRGARHAVRRRSNPPGCGCDGAGRGRRRAAAARVRQLSRPGDRLSLLEAGGARPARCRRRRARAACGRLSRPRAFRAEPGDGAARRPGPVRQRAAPPFPGGCAVRRSSPGSSSRPR
jgi:hypothetical protein